MTETCENCGCQRLEHSFFGNCPPKKFTPKNYSPFTDLLEEAKKIVKPKNYSPAEFSDKADTPSDKSYLRSDVDNSKEGTQNQEKEK